MDTIKGLPLFLHGKRISSYYSLIGHDENALTYALGHCLTFDREFLSSFLRRCQFKHVTSANVGHAEIHLQKREYESGIVDLEIFIQDRVQLIVEAKVKGGFPSIAQVRTYIKRLKDRNIESKVVVLTKITDDKVKDDLKREFGKKIGFLLWSDILKISINIADHDDKSNELRDFIAFMKEVYSMNINAEEEVWIVPLSTTWKAKSINISVADFHVQHKFWVMGNNKPRHSIYMGFRYNGYLQCIGRIIRIDRRLKSSQIVPKAPKIAREFWHEKYGPWDVVRLEKLIPFPKKLRSGNIHNKHIYCDFDLLLTSDSILEAESRMIKRRKRNTAER